MSGVNLRHAECRHNSCKLTAQWLIGSEVSGLEVCGKHLGWGLKYHVDDRPPEGVGKRVVQVRTHSGWVRT